MLLDHNNNQLNTDQWQMTTHYPHNKMMEDMQYNKIDLFHPSQNYNILDYMLLVDWFHQGRMILLDKPHQVNRLCRLLEML